jgi:type VI protein secretion system component Hcp
VSVKQSGQLAGGQIPVEQVALKYATVKQSFTAFAANGTKGATTMYSYAVK